LINEGGIILDLDLFWFTSDATFSSLHVVLIFICGTEDRRQAYIEMKRQFPEVTETVES